jgi:hypothetical protein
MRLLSLVFLAGALASALTADTFVYNNLSEASAGADGVGFVGPLYDSFSSGAAGSITGLQLMLSGDDTSSGTLDVGLYADNSTSPGQLIATLGSISDSALSETPATYDISLKATPLLVSNTLYWIGLYGTTTGEWSYDYDDSGIGVANDYFANQLGVFSNVNDPYQMSVLEGASSVPEPANFLVVAAGLGFLTLLRRRATRRTA